MYIIHIVYVYTQMADQSEKYWIMNDPHEMLLFTMDLTKFVEGHTSSYTCDQYQPIVRWIWYDKGL